VRVDVLRPISPADDAFESSKALADLARKKILEVLDESDLLAKMNV
jgi:hypothetical protein